jgi:hypothetical protein
MNLGYNDIKAEDFSGDILEKYSFPKDQLLI